LSVGRNCRLSLEAAVQMARFWTGLTLPPEVQDTALWPKPGTVEEEVWSLAIRRGESIPSSIRLRIRTIPDTRGKLWFLFRFVFPHPDAMYHYRSREGRSGLLAAYVRRWLQVFR
jgi:hypothetical protein